MALALTLATALSAQEPVALDSVKPAAIVQGSRVRIVRVSKVQGEVRMDRGKGQGFEAGFANVPVVEDTRIRTLKDSWTGIEFEDKSKLRLSPDSELKFTALRRDPAGAPLSEIDFDRGTVEVSLTKKNAEHFLIRAGGKTLHFLKPSHIFLDVLPSGSRLVVVKGAVRADDASGSSLVDSGRPLEFRGIAASAELCPPERAR